MTDDDSLGEFDPDDIDEISRILESIFEQENNGYEMVFYISYSDAKELLASYKRYSQGSIPDAAKCLREFHKIIEQLREVVESDEQGF